MDLLHIQHVYGAWILFSILIVSVARGEYTSTFGLLIPKSLPKAPPPVVFSYAPNLVPITEAKAFVVYDIATQKIIVSKNENVVLPLASMTKLATAVTAMELASSTKRITITPDILDEGYDIGLLRGQQFTLGELIKYMLVFSSNDGANAIAQTLGGKKYFIDAMNTLAIRENMKTLFFTNPNGLDSKTEFGGIGSSLDVARLMAYAYQHIPALLDATTKSRAKILSSTGMLTGIPNTNQFVEHFSGISGSKTGFTDEAGGNLTVVFDIALGRPVVIVVMGSTKSDRFIDVEKLYTFAKKALQ